MLLSGLATLSTSECFHFCGPQENRIVLSCSHGAPFIPQPVILAHYFSRLSQEHQVKPVLIYKATCYPKAITIPDLKPRACSHFHWILKLLCMLFAGSSQLRLEEENMPMKFYCLCMNITALNQKLCEHNCRELIELIYTHDSTDF